jgi:osmotically-inducible protein OsmY
VAREARVKKVKVAREARVKKVKVAREARDKRAKAARRVRAKVKDRRVKVAKEARAKVRAIRKDKARAGREAKARIARRPKVKGTKRKRKKRKSERTRPAHPAVGAPPAPRVPVAERGEAGRRDNGSTGNRGGSLVGSRRSTRGYASAVLHSARPRPSRSLRTKARTKKMSRYIRFAPCLSIVLLAACKEGDRDARAAESVTTIPAAQDGRADSTPTASGQSNAKADIDHLAEIRKAIVDDDNLSVAAKNVTVVTSSGRVTLRGTVSTDEERKRVEDLAKRSSATLSVDNQIQVKAN